MLPTNYEFGFIEELFNGNPTKNIKGPCHQVIDGGHAFARLYNKHKGEDGVDTTVELNLEPLLWCRNLCKLRCRCSFHH